MNVLDDHSYLIILAARSGVSHVWQSRCRWRFLWTSGSGGHQQARGGDQACSVTLPPLMAGRHQRRLDVPAIVATHLVGCSSATTPVINGALGRMSQDLGPTPCAEGYVTSTLLIGAAIGAVLCGQINDAPGRPPGRGARRTSLRPHLVTWCGSLCISKRNRLW